MLPFWVQVCKKNYQRCGQNSRNGVRQGYLGLLFQISKIFEILFWKIFLTKNRCDQTSRLKGCHLNSYSLRSAQAAHFMLLLNFRFHLESTETDTMMWHMVQLDIQKFQKEKYITNFHQWVISTDITHICSLTFILHLNVLLR